MRIDGGTRRMGPFDISRHVNELVRNHYQPVLNDLHEQINQLLDQRGVQRVLKPDHLDSHQEQSNFEFLVFNFVESF